MVHFLTALPDWVISCGILLVAVVAARIVHKILFSAAERFVRQTGSVIDNSLVRHGHRPAKLIIPLLA